MGRAEVEIVRGIYAANARRDGEAPFAFYASDIEWDVTEVGGGVVLGQVYRGHEGVRRFWQEWLMGFETIELEVEDVVDAGADVLVTIHERTRGRTSGAVIDRRHYAVWTLRDGEVVRMVAYLDRDKALAAAGLES